MGISQGIRQNTLETDLDLDGQDKFLVGCLVT